MTENASFSKALRMWYLVNRRELPWRNSKDPYFIWLSEIILQQTKISQGLSYYDKFTGHFQDIFELARADEEEVLKLWQGLGYYSRARNLHHTAKNLVKKHNGVFPRSYKELRDLKGIGDYTASAIASIAFDLPHATVDGNVYRVLSRYFGIDTPINVTSGTKLFKELAESLLDPEDPGTHNQALMDFGAMVCTPKNPKCGQCIFKDSCLALQRNLVDQLPVKLKKTKIRKRHFNFVVLDQDKEYTRVTKRTQRDIWMHLYQFPMVETPDVATDFGEIEQWVKEDFNLKNNYHVRKFNAQPVEHKLTHQHIYCDFWILDTTEKVKDTLNWEDIRHRALPVVLQNFVDKYKNGDF